jgi:hypothetical protein
MISYTIQKRKKRENIELKKEEEVNKITSLN